MANAKSKPFKGPNRSAVEALISKRVNAKKRGKGGGKSKLPAEEIGEKPGAPDPDDTGKKKGK